MVFYSMDPDLVDANIQFEVRRDFQPTVTTETSSKELQRAQKVTNQVTSGINATAGDEWVTDLRISVSAKVGAVVKTYRRGCRSCDSWGWGGWRLPSWAGAGVIQAGPCSPGRTPQSLSISAMTSRS